MLRRAAPPEWASFSCLEPCFEGVVMGWNLGPPQPAGMNNSRSFRVQIPPLHRRQPQGDGCRTFSSSSPHGKLLIDVPFTDALPPIPSSFRALGITMWGELILTSGCLHLQTGCQVEWAAWAPVSPGWVSRDSCVSENFSRSQLPWRALTGTHH